MTVDAAKDKTEAAPSYMTETTQSEPSMAENATTTTAAPISDQELDEAQKAIEAVDQAFGVEDASDEDDDDERFVFTKRQRRLLNMRIPDEAYITRERNGEQYRYVQAFVIDYLADIIFGDQWSTDVLEDSIVSEGKTTVRFKDGDGNDRPVETTVYRVVAKAKVRVTVTGRGGRQVYHTAIGTSSYDAAWDDLNISDAYRIAIKGAVTDGKRTALRNFGKAFGLIERDTEGLIDRIRQMQKLKQDAVEKQAARREHRRQSEESRSKASQPIPARGVRVAPGSKGRALKKPQARQPRMFELFDTNGVCVASFVSADAYCEAFRGMLKNVRNKAALDDLVAYNQDVIASLDGGKGAKTKIWSEKVGGLIEGKTIDLIGGRASLVELPAPAADKEVPEEAEAKTEGQANVPAETTTEGSAENPGNSGSETSVEKVAAGTGAPAEKAGEAETASASTGAETSLPSTTSQEAAADNPPKRRRGRPPGSKNKKTLARDAAERDGILVPPSDVQPKRKRGRPPGSRNKKTLEALAAKAAAEAADKEGGLGETEGDQVIAAPKAASVSEPAVGDVAPSETPASKVPGQAAVDPAQDAAPSSAQEDRAEESSSQGPAKEDSADASATGGSTVEILLPGLEVALDAEGRLINTISFGQQLVEVLKAATDTGEVEFIDEVARPFFKYLKPSAAGFIESKIAQRMRELSGP
jgi:high mobility group AT-hook protein 2